MPAIKPESRKTNYHMGQINLNLKPVLNPLPDLMYISYERDPNP